MQSREQQRAEMYQVMVNGTPEEQAAYMAKERRETGIMCWWIIGVPLLAYLGYRLIRRAVAAGVRDAQRRD